MPLLKNNKTPFTEAFGTLIGNGTGKVAEVSKLMFEFVSFVNEIFQKTNIGGLTSHASIIILDQYEEQNVLGRISAEDLTHYKFEYGRDFLKENSDVHIVNVPVNDKIAVQKAFLAMLEFTGDWNNNSEFVRAKSGI